MTDQLSESVTAQSGQVLTGRLKPGADLVQGLEQVCDRHGVRFAAIAFAYGSLTRATFKVLEKPEGDDRDVLVPRELDERVEFLGGQGLICEDEDGRRATHLHGSVARQSGAVYGGHFEPGRNPIYNNLDFVLVELHGVELLRGHDAETDTVEMRVSQLDA